MVIYTFPFDDEQEQQEARGLEVDEPNDTRNKGIDRDQKRKFAEKTINWLVNPSPPIRQSRQGTENEEENELIAVWCRVSYSILYNVGRGRRAS
jgi:hypothetical protein